MQKKLPSDAYDYYVSLCTGRSYQAVANHYGVAKQTVVTRALNERWQARIEALEREARITADKRFQEELIAGKEIHFKACRAILGKGIETLKSVPMTSAMDAVRAIDMAIRNERMLLGEPTERSAVSVEQVLREEFHNWMLKPGEEEDWDLAEPPENGKTTQST